MPINNAQFYGLNKGSAQVIDNSGIDNTFAGILAKQQAQRQQEIKQITDEQAKLNPDGLRNDADRKDFFNQVNDWRSKAIAASNERDPYKRSLLKSQADQTYMQAQALVDQSKKAGQTESGFGTQLLNPTVRDRYSPDVVNNYLKNKQLGVNDPNFIKDPNSWEQIANHETALAGLDKIADARLKQTQYATPVLTRKNVGGRMATFINNSRTADPAALAQDIGTHYDVDQNLRKTFQDIYPDIYSNQQLNPAQQKQAAISQYLKDRGPVAQYHEPVEKVDPQPDRFYEHYNYEIAHPKPGTAIANAPTPSQILITDMQKGLPGTGEKLVSLAPKGQYGGNKPAIGIDKNTGEHVFTFPAQITEDKAAIKANATLKQEAAVDKSSVDPADLKPEHIVKVPGKEYRLNPNSPTYVADAAQMAKDQNINLTQLNQVEGVKGGHGQIKEVQMKGSHAEPTYTIKGKEYKTDAVEKAAKASGMSVGDYVKAVNGN